MLNISLSRELKVGLFAIAGLVTFFFGYNFLKGTEFFNGTKTYYLIFEDVKSLPQAASVKLLGNPVGKVSSFQLMQKDGKYRWVVAITMDNKVVLRKGTVGELASGGVLDGPSINLIIPTEQTEIAKPGDTLNVVIGKGMLDGIQATADKIMPKIDTTLTNINRLTDKETKESLKRIFENLEKTTSSLNKTIEGISPSLELSLKNIAELTASLSKTEKQLKPILSKFDNIADSIQKSQIQATIAQTRKTIDELNGVVAKINSGEGSLGKLVKSDSLHNNLNQTVKDLDKLFIDLQANPKRYVHFSVFGKKEK